MNILLVSFIFSPNIGGVESHLDDLVSYLDRRGHRITIITYQPLLLDRSAPSIERKGNIEIRRIPWIKFNLFNRLENTPILQILYLVPPILFYTLWYLLRNGGKIDVLQTHGFNMAIVGAIAGVFFRKRFTANTHVSFSFRKKNFYATILGYVLNRASKILVLTQGAATELAKIGVKKEKIVIYHQWIDIKVFSPKDQMRSRAKYNLPKDRFIVFYAGRFVPAKGVSLLLEVARLVSKKTLFVFVGSGELRDVIQAQARKNPIIRFVGEVKREDLPYYYSASDLCIIPSTPVTKIYSEGIPRVMIEAFSCGTPVAATKIGGVAELITSDVGFFIKPDKDILVSFLNTLSRERTKLRSMREDCIRYAKEQFDYRTNASIIEKSLKL